MLIGKSIGYLKEEDFGSRGSISVILKKIVGAGVGGQLIPMNPDRPTNNYLIWRKDEMSGHWIETNDVGIFSGL